MFNVYHLCVNMDNTHNQFVMYFILFVFYSNFVSSVFFQHFNMYSFNYVFGVTSDELMRSYLPSHLLAEVTGGNRPPVTSANK